MRAASIIMSAVMIAACSACDAPRDHRTPAERAQAEAAYDRYRRPDLLISALELRGDERVLDVGAGDGYLTLPLARAVEGRGRVVAIDVDAGALAALRDRVLDSKLDVQVETRVVAADDPALGEERYELMLLGEVDHFLPDRARYFRNLRAHLAEHGQIAISNKRVHRDAVLRAASDAGLVALHEFNDLPAHFLIRFGAAP